MAIASNGRSNGGGAADAGARAPLRGETTRRMAVIWAASPLRAVQGKARAAAFGIATLEEFEPRHRPMIEGQALRAVALIGAGRIRVERARVGAPEPFSLGHRGPGDAIGLSALGSSDGLATATATVVDAGDAMLLPLRPLRQLAIAEPAVRAALEAAIVSAHADAQRRLELLLRHGVEVRLARLLLDAVARWGEPHRDGVLITAPYTHQEIAAIIGSTRETVTLLFGKLRRDGALTVERRRVVVTDRARLDEVAAVAHAGG
jgi:CRP-like cAMP-binding protein